MFTTWSEIKYIAASATRLGDFEIYWLKFSYKSSPNMLLLLGNLQKCHFLGKTCGS